MLWEHRWSVGNCYEQCGLEFWNSNTSCHRYFWQMRRRWHCCRRFFSTTCKLKSKSGTWRIQVMWIQIFPVSNDLVGSVLFVGPMRVKRSLTCSTPSVWYSVLRKGMSLRRDVHCHTRFMQHRRTNAPLPLQFSSGLKFFLKHGLSLRHAATMRRMVSPIVNSQKRICVRWFVNGYDFNIGEH